MFFLKKRQAELIVALAETENLRKSSEQLHITQPAASKLLAQVEADCGFALFERGANGTVPTESGQLVIAYAREILHSTQRIQHELTRQAGQSQRSLSLGALPSATISIVPELVCRLMDDIEDLQVYIEDGTIQPLLDKLRMGKLDLVIGRCSEHIDLADFHRTFLNYEPMVLVCGRQHPLAARREITPPDLQAADWIFPPADTYADTKLSELCDKYGLTHPRILARSSVTMTNVIMLTRKNLLAALPLGIAQYFVKQGSLRILPIAKTVNFGEFVLFTRKQTIYCPNAALIRKVRSLLEQGSEPNATAGIQTGTPPT